MLLGLLCSYHVTFALLTFVCFKMLAPGLFSNSRVLPRRSDNELTTWQLVSAPADLTDNFNNMPLSGFQCCL